MRQASAIADEPPRGAWATKGFNVGADPDVLHAIAAIMPKRERGGGTRWLTEIEAKALAKQCETFLRSIADRQWPTEVLDSLTGILDTVLASTTAALLSETSQPTQPTQPTQSKHPTQSKQPTQQQQQQQQQQQGARPLATYTREDRPRQQHQPDSARDGEVLSNVW